MSTFFPDLTAAEEFSFDTETTGLDPNAGARVFGFSVSLDDGTDHYWDIRKEPESVRWFNDQVRKSRANIICHNLSFDYRMATVTGLKMPELSRLYDTSMHACLINEHEHSYSLENLAKKYTNEYKKGDELYHDLARLFGGRATKNCQIHRISQAPVEIVAPYAKGDTRATLALHQYQKRQIIAQELQDIVAFERSVTPIIVKSEMHGVRVDTSRAEQAVGELSVQIDILQTQLDSVAGFKCNPQPSGDIKKLFKPEWKDGRWWACDGTPLEMTDAGAPSLGADAMRLMKHPAARLILELRSLIKTRDTFLVGHVLESAQNGRVYPTINQCKGEEGGTGTGRLSYVAPALQQIPDRNKKVASIVKPVFLPDLGHSWVDCDKKSFEVRIFGHLIGTPDIQEVYRKDPETDFHQYVADLTGLVRNATYTGQPNAKQLNLSMIFNQGNGTTAEEMGLPWSWETFTSREGEEIVYKKAGPEAMAIINEYHKSMPGVKKLADGCKATAEKRGYLFTRRGRHLRFPRGYQSYKASGILIQATSADENKQSWRCIAEALEGTDGKQLLNTHDSYSLSLPIGEEEVLAKKVKKAVEADRGLRVPLILEVCHPGRDWWDSKSKKRWL